MTEQPEKRRELSWDEIERLVGIVAQKLANEKFDVWMGISRGGSLIAVLLGHCFEKTGILHCSMNRYDEEGRKLPQPKVLQFPEDSMLKGKRVLIIDDVWDEGITLTRAIELVRRASGIPFIVTLHYKPESSTKAGEPDIYAEETDEWIDYPWETIAGRVL